MNTRKKIEVFSAGCSTCKETIELVRKIAGSSHEVVVHDLQKTEVASKAKQHGVRSVPAVVIDGKLAGCCAGLGLNWSKSLQIKAKRAALSKSAARFLLPHVRTHGR